MIVSAVRMIGGSGYLSGAGRVALSQRNSLPATTGANPRTSVRTGKQAGPH